MHVLFLTYDVPFPPNSGGKTRAYNLIKYGKHDAKISLFSFNRPGYDLSHLDALKDLGVHNIELFPRKSKTHPRSIGSLISQKHSIFYTLYFDEKVADTIISYVKEHNVDIVHFESFYTGFYLSEELAKLGVKQVYGSENIEYKLYEEGLKSAPFMLRPLLKRETNKIRMEEIQMAKNANAVLAVTTDEAAYFEKMSQTKAHVIENGVSIEDFPKISEKNHKKLKLLFLGNFSYFPNRDAIEYFIKHIWPSLSSEEFDLTVVGKGVTTYSVLSDPAIEKIEYVPDIYDAYAMADVFISPMQYGGGTNFKVLEAMAAGLPVVALDTKIGSIEAKDGVDLCIATNANDFISSLHKLKKDRDYRINLGKNARALVMKKYSWETIGTNLYTIWKNLL